MKIMIIEDDLTIAKELGKVLELSQLSYYEQLKPESLSNSYHILLKMTEVFLLFIIVKLKS